MKIQRIAVRHVRGFLSRRVCELRVGGKEYAWPFHDLVEFSDGLQDVLAETEQLVPTNAVRPTDKTFMQLEGLRVQDASEHNRNLYSGREVQGLRDEGVSICGGDWYAEIAINGSDSDLSFSTVAELFQCVQTIIKRELGASGQDLPREPALLVARAS